MNTHALTHIQIFNKAFAGQGQASAYTQKKQESESASEWERERSNHGKTEKSYPISVVSEKWALNQHLEEFNIVIIITVNILSSLGGCHVY